MTPFRRIALFLLIPWAGLLARAGSPETEFRQLSKDLRAIPYDAFIYNAEPAGLKASGSPAKDWARFKKARGFHHTFEELVPFLEDADPHVRTLAILALFDLGDRRAIPLIFAHSHDGGSAFPNLTVTFDSSDTPPPPFTERRSVSQIAHQLLVTVGGDFREVEEFESWKVSHLDNPDWLGWYRFRAARLGGVRASVIPHPEIEAFRKELEALPQTRRSWAILEIGESAGGDAFRVEHAAKELGTEALLHFLRDGTRQGLKDNGATSSERGRTFILQDAKELFREADADALVAMGHYLAAAEVRPAMAGPWLRRALEEWKEPYQLSQRGRAMGALAALGGDGEAEFAARMFYEAPGDSQKATFPKAFLVEFGRIHPTHWQTAIGAIVARPEFETLDGDLVYWIAVTVQNLPGVERSKIDAELGSPTQTRQSLRSYLGLPNPSGTSSNAGGPPSKLGHPRKRH